MPQSHARAARGRAPSSQNPSAPRPKPKEPQERRLSGPEPIVELMERGKPR